MADSHLLAIVDGLGHGPEAAKAAEAALRVVRAHSELALPELLTEIDVSLAATRGAAIGLVRIQGRRAWHAGVGNTRVLHWRGDRMQRLSSQPGIVGGGLPRHLQVTELDLQPDDWLLLFTDGLDEMLNLPAHLPEWDRDPALLCDHLLAHARAGRDDAGVLVCHAERL
jgi:serine phosphatase RsbU (regulator of sigma subunit)